MNKDKPNIRPEKYHIPSIRHGGTIFTGIRSCSRRLAVVTLSLSTAALLIIMAGSSDHTQTMDMYSGGTYIQGPEETVVDGAEANGTQRLHPRMQLHGRTEEYFRKDFSYLQYISISKTVTKADEAFKFNLEDHGINKSRLINLTDFKYKINKEDFCPPHPEEPFLIVLVHSAIQNRPKRDAIRLSWGLKVPVLFFLGATSSEADQRRLLAEDSIFHDVVQGSFLDAYKNLTYKHAMVLKWALTFCPQVKYLVKMDDDSFLNVPYLIGTLHDLSPTGARNLLLCDVHYHSKVLRGGKWKVTREEWPDDTYPDYCNGWIIVYSMDVAARIYLESFKHKYNWIDDVHITGTLAKALQITHSNFSSLILNFEEKSEVPPKSHVLGIFPLDEITVVSMTHRFMNSQLTDENNENGSL